MLILAQNKCSVNGRGGEDSCHRFRGSSFLNLVHISQPTGRTVIHEHLKQVLDTNLSKSVLDTDTQTHTQTPTPTHTHTSIFTPTYVSRKWPL